MSEVSAAPNPSAHTPQTPQGGAQAWSDQALDDPQQLQACTVWSEDDQGRRVAETTLALQGIHCTACASIIEAAALRVPGVLEAKVQAATHRAVVRFVEGQTLLSTIVAAIRHAGYDAAPATRMEAEARRRRERQALTWRLFVAAFCAMQVMMLATPSYVAPQGDLAPDLAALLNWGQWLLSVPVMLFSSWPFMAQAWRALRDRHMVMDVPVALGMLVMFVASTIATFWPAGPLGAEVVFDSLTMFVSFLLGARWLEMRTRHRAQRELESLLHQVPRPVIKVLADGRTLDVMPQALAPGDRIRIPVGEAFPVDGLILSGRTVVSESLMTGESAPMPRDAGQQVMAGSLNLGAPVEICVTAVGSHTRRERLLQLAERAALERPMLVQRADRWAGPFLWLVLGLALVAGVVWHAVDPSRALWVAVAVLIVTCPCALSLAAPAALMAAARGLLREGLLVQRLSALEDLARIDGVVFDKTGTLTEDELIVMAVRDVPTAQARDEALQAAASLAVWSRHSAARALVQAAGSGARGVTDEPTESAPWHEVREFTGLGLQARDAQGTLWRLGRRRWVEGLWASSKSADGLEEALGSELAWGHAHGLVARFELSDRLRQEAPAALAALRRQGLEVSLLSGDRPSQVQAVAQALGLPVLGAGALPQDKLQAIAALQQQGRTMAMVGDGVNDTPVLARSQVSFAMGHGSATTLARADLVVMASNLMAIPQSVARARLMDRVIRQNLAWALAYNLAAIPVALAGYLPPWAAGAGMALSSLLVVINSTRAAAPMTRSPAVAPQTTTA